MTEPDIEEILDDLTDFPASIITPGTPGPTGLPERWRPVAEATDPAARRSAALSMWSPEFLSVVPGFARALQADLADVRVARHPVDSQWILIYALRDVHDGLRCWIGCDPVAADPSSPPVYWDLLPEQVRHFLRTTHSGFTTGDGEAHGIMPAQHMQLYAPWTGFEDGPIPGWDGSDGRISSAEMMVVTTDGNQLHVCVSPHAPTGAVLVYQGNVSIRDDLCAELDTLMSERLELG